MSDFIWLSEARMDGIEPYFHYRATFLTSTIGGSSAGLSS